LDWIGLAVAVTYEFITYLFILFITPDSRSIDNLVACVVYMVHVCVCAP